MRAAAAVLKRIERFTGAGAIRKLAGLFGASGVSRGSQLLLAVVVARIFGPHGYGAFVFATSTAVFCSFIAALGWPNLMNRVIPVMIRDREWHVLKGVLRAGDIVALAASAAFAAVLLTMAAFLPKEAFGLELAALLTFPFVLAALRRQQLAAVKRPALGLLFDQGFASLAVIVLLLVVPLSLDATLIVFAVAMLVGAAVATVIVRRLLPSNMIAARAAYRWRQWHGLAFPMMVGQSAKLIISRMDVLLLVPLAGIYEAGLYGAAFRLTYLLTFPQALLATVTMPLFSEAFAAGNMGRVHWLLQRSLLFALATSLPFVVPVVIAPEWLMGTLFGRPFAVAGTTLLILTIGQVATALSMPYQAILMMGGGERGFGIANLAIMVANLIACLAVVPRYGAEGAAFVTSATGFLLLFGQIALARPLLRARRTA